MNTTAVENGSFNVEKFFYDEARDPFFYDLSFNCEKMDQFFTKVKDIFIKGLIIHVGDAANNSLNLDNVTEDDVEKIGKYMLSFGIKTIFKKIDEEEIHFLLSGLIYEIEKLDDLEINVTTNWKTNCINKVQLSVMNNNEETLKQIMLASEKHYRANHFLKFKPVTDLKDYVIYFNKPTEKYSLNFDIAKVWDYRIDRGCKYVF